MCVVYLILNVLEFEVIYNMDRSFQSKQDSKDKLFFKTRPAQVRHLFFVEKLLRPEVSLASDLLALVCCGRVG